MMSSFSDTFVESGCDEAGRGCLAGPVFAAAVILPKDYFHPKLNDSKKLNARDRFILREVIESEAIGYSVSSVDESEIDQINILQASIKAMHKAISGLRRRPELLLIDGNKFSPFEDIPYHCIIKGDSKYASIAAASILAKTYRDEYMIGLSESFPQYGWEQNKGYPTLQHRKAIMNFGSTSHHRKSFVVKQPEILFP